jgi:hypothetical protein
MSKIANIKAFAANVRAVAVMNKHFELPEQINGSTILYRVHELSNGRFAVEGFRASMADGTYLTFHGEAALGNLWVGSKRLVLDDVTAKDRESIEFVPLEMHFYESKYNEFIIAEDNPIIELVVDADVLNVVEEAVAV